MGILEEKVQKMLVSELESINSTEKDLNELFGIPAANFEQQWQNLTNSEPPTTPINVDPAVGSPTNDPSPDVKVESLKLKDLYQLMLKHPSNMANRLGPEGLTTILEYIITRFIPGAPEFDPGTEVLDVASELEVSTPEKIVKIGEFVEQVAKNPEAMLKLVNRVLGKDKKDPAAPDKSEEPGEPGEQEEDTGISLKKLKVGMARKAINQLKNMGVSSKEISSMIEKGAEKIVKNACALGAGAQGRKFTEEDLPVINKIKDEVGKILDGDFSNLVKESKDLLLVHPITYAILDSIINEISVQTSRGLDSFNINNNSENKLETLMPVLQEFLPWAKKQLGFDRAVNISFISDPENAKDPMGTTGHYQPHSDTVTIYVDGRHPKDILRSLSHELVHHNQNCNGKLEQIQYTGEGYAQTDKVGKECEDEAYLIGNGRLVRTFGDTIWNKPPNLEQGAQLMENKTKKTKEKKVEDVVKKQADFKKYVNGGKDEALFEKLSKEWCK
jgi:hypothetical protein